MILEPLCRRLQSLFLGIVRARLFAAVRPGDASLRVSTALCSCPVSARWKTLVRSNVARPVGRRCRRPRISRSGDSADDGESLPSESCGQGCSRPVEPGDASLRVSTPLCSTPVSARWKTLVRSSVARPVGREMCADRGSRSGDSADYGRVSSLGIVRARLFAACQTGRRIARVSTTLYQLPLSLPVGKHWSAAMSLDRWVGGVRRPRSRSGDSADRQSLFPRNRAGKAVRSLSDWATHRSESRPPLPVTPVSARWKTLVRSNVARPVGQRWQTADFPLGRLCETAECLRSEQCFSRLLASPKMPSGTGDSRHDEAAGFRESEVYTSCTGRMNKTTRV